MDLLIISSSFEMATVVKGLYNALSIMLNNPSTVIRATHENSPMNSPDFATSPARFDWPALWHACIDYNYSLGNYGSIQKLCLKK